MGDPKRHGYANHIVHGFLAVGKRRVSHLLKNCAAISKAIGGNWYYPYAGTVTIMQQLTVDQHKKLLSRIIEEFVMLGLSGSWEREITIENLINYHFTFRAAPAHLMAKRARKLRDIIRKVTTIKLNQHYRPMPSYHDATEWINYCSKLKFTDIRPNMKTDDVDVITKTKANDDIYRNKRVLFKKMKTGERLLRHGDFGDFWEQSPTQSTAQYNAKKKKREANRQAAPDIQEAAKELASLTKDDPIRIEDRLYKDLEKEGDPIKRQAIEKQNHQLAAQHHGGVEDYVDYRRQLKEQQAREEAAKEFRKQNPRKKKVKTPLIPFHPDNCDSIATNA